MNLYLESELKMKEIIINIVSIVVSDVNFMLAMLVIVLVSACFLGRYIVISRKMIIATCGILLIQILIPVIVELVLSKVYPTEYAYLDSMNAQDVITSDDPIFKNVYIISSVMSAVLNGMAFLYAFIFYFISNKEKRLFRAIESTVCLYLYYSYVNSVIQYSYLYLKGGKVEVFSNLLKTVGGKDNQLFMIVQIVAGFIVSLSLFLILYFAYYKKKRFYVVRVRGRILFIVWLIILSIFPSIPFIYETVDEQYKMLSYVFGVLLPIVGGVAPILFVMNVAEKSLKEKNEYQETYLKAELDYIEQYKRTQTETRAFRHDIINNLSLTDMMLDEGKVEDASAHIKELLGNVRALSPSVITGDEMLDCIVAMKADKMKEKDINFSSDGVVDGGLHMKAMDVCSIFANALDNAIEAAEKTSSDAWVDLKIKRNDKFAIIKISNSAATKVNVEKLFMTSGYTSKKDTEHHGFGLSNIRRTVEDYDGLIKAESDDESFSLSIMIPRVA